MDDRTLSRGYEGKPKILRESEFYGGCIRVKISVRNTSSLAILDAELELKSDERILHFDRCEPEEYQEKKGKIILGNINPHNDRTISFYLDPLICAKEGTDINCRLNFKYADGTLDTAYMEKLKIQVVCPIFRTEHDINIGRLKELIKELQSHDSKVYTIPKRVDMTESLKTCRNVIQQHDVRHIKTFKTTDDTTYECWYFGKTKVTKKDLVIKCAIRRDTDSIEIFVSGNDPKDITGLLAEIGRNLTKEFDKIGKVQPVFNVIIKNSKLKGSNLLSYCDMNGICGGNVVIEDSFLDDTNVASWIQEDKETTRIKEQKMPDEARKQEEQREAELLRKAQDAQTEKERRIRQSEEAARIPREKEDKRARIEHEKKSSGGKWFFGVIIILAVLALGWYGTQDSSSPAVSAPQKTPPSAIMTAKATPSAAALVTSSADQKTITNSIGMEFVQIPAGEFDMGSPSNEVGRYDEEGPVHHVQISKTFYMGKYEVTQKQWRTVMGNSPSYFKGDELPVGSVSWNDIQEFVKKLNQRENINKYRLPSEAEWEYAARAGTTTRYFFGDDELKLSAYAWYSVNSDSKTHPVGQKKPNPWGLYDIYGNAAEAVQDTRHSSYLNAPPNGSAWETIEAARVWTSDNSTIRVTRGGSYFGNTGDLRSASRRPFVPQNNLILYLSFRIVKEI